MTGIECLPSNGEKPPFMISSRSQSCCSLSTIEESFSASAASCCLLGASLAIKSLRTPPTRQLDRYLNNQTQDLVYHGEDSPFKKFLLYGFLLVVFCQGSMFLQRYNISRYRIIMHAPM